MKKALYLIVTIVFALSSFCCAGYASENQAVSMETSMAANLVAGEVARVNCRITGGETLVGASMEFFLDGSPVQGMGSAYFVIGKENTEVFDFFVPSNLNPYYQHTLLAVLKCDNGQELYGANIFTYSPQPDVSMKFYTTPVEVNAGYELYYGIEFSVPDGKTYAANTATYVRGVTVPEACGQIIIYDGFKILISVPQMYNMTDPSDFDFVYDVSIASGTQNLRLSSKELEAQKNAKVIKPLIIPASVLKTTNGYSNSSLTGYVTTVNAGEVVEYLNPDNHNSMRAAKIKLSSGVVCWVAMSAIYISEENYTIPDELTDYDREAFVNSAGYSSPTDYLIWVNKERQRLTVFMGNQGNWHVVRTFPVATGKNQTPTPTTVCEYKFKTRWETATYICDPVLSLYDGYAIHNQPVSLSGRVTDTTIGNPASAGCIRMLKEDVDWVYLYVPVKTTVVLY